MLVGGGGYQLMYSGPLSGRRRILSPERWPGPTGSSTCPQTSRAMVSSERPDAGAMPERILEICSDSEREERRREEGGRRETESRRRDRRENIAALGRARLSHDEGNRDEKELYPF